MSHQRGPASARTVDDCCGGVCRFTKQGLPVARVMLCGREITKEESDAAKASFIKYGPKENATIDWTTPREPQYDGDKK